MESGSNVVSGLKRPPSGLRPPPPAKLREGDTFALPLLVGGVSVSERRRTEGVLGKFNKRHITQ